MSQQCVGCGHPIRPGEAVDFGTFALCPVCSEDLFEVEESEVEVEEWARLNAEQSREDREEES